jgi:hypothetical protein
MMGVEQLIALDQFCAFHDVEISFISSLRQSGLIETIEIDDSWFIEPDQLNQLEKFVRLYYELNINLEGIETINHLLQRISVMQDEVINLRNKLRFYEPE